MVSHWKTDVTRALMAGELDLDAGGDDIRVILCMSNTDADTNKDAKFVGDLVTLDEMDGTNYARKTATGELLTVDLAGDKTRFDIDDETWTALGVGTRQVVGAIVYKFVTNDADSPMLTWNEVTPFDPVGDDVTFQWDALGVGELEAVV